MEFTTTELAEGRRIAGLVAEGRLTAERVAVAAGLFHAGARASRIKPVRLSHGYRDRIMAGLVLLPAVETVRIAHECAKRAVPAWCAVSEADRTVPSALEACSAWLSGVRGVDLRAHVESIAVTIEGVESSLDGGVPPVEVASGLYAAHAVAHVTEAAALCDEGSSMVSNFASSAVAAASESSEDLIGEMTWQLNQVVVALLSPR